MLHALGLAVADAEIRSLIAHERIAKNAACLVDVQRKAPTQRVRVHIECGGEVPTVVAQQKTVVAQMVVCVRYGDGEEDPPVQFFEVAFGSCTLLAHEFHEVEIASAVGAACAILSSEECHGRREVDALSRYAVEPLAEECGAVAAESTFLCVGDVDSERSRKVMSEKLHNAGIERVMP